MTQPLIVQLTDAAFAALRLQASAAAQTPEQAAAAALEQRFGSPATGDSTRPGTPGALRRHFGAVRSNTPFNTADNHRIDEDLARAYADDDRTD